MSLRSRPREPKSRKPLLQHFPLHSLERAPAVERSLSGPAEHRPAQRETDSESSRRLAPRGFQVTHSGSPVAMTQRVEAWMTCFAGLEPRGVFDSPLRKSPAHRPERRLPLAFDYREPTC